MDLVDFSAYGVVATAFPGLTSCISTLMWKDTPLTKMIDLTIMKAVCVNFAAYGQLNNKK